MKRTAWLGGTCLCLVALIWFIAFRGDEETRTASRSAPVSDQAEFEHANWNLADKPRATAKRPTRPARLEGVEIAVAKESR